ncbi:NB-ARC domain-containing protein [Kribbella deserti]|uniref:NB-ARC domain-containing protein n=1 Tax=Kribbella deserti TaxID=1926257 RepID=A0ABV6QQB2_9ACTN
MAETFGDLLRHFRLRAEYTQQQLAERTALSVQTVSTLERGTRNAPRRETVLLLAQALRLTSVEQALLLSASRPGTVQAPARDAVVGRWVMPRMLPAGSSDFTGREEQVSRLTAALMPPAPGAQGAVRIATVSGMGGVGKTTLALHVAHRLHEQFPDGQLYLDLRGFGPGEPMTTADGLAFLLEALGTPPSEVPRDPALRTAKYRTLLAGRRVLVVLDNALGSDQVQPLIPGTAGSAAVVTSRRSLTTMPGATHVQLAPFSEREALSLLSSIVGRDRVESEQSGAEELARRCGYLPLAMRILSARLVARPHWPFSMLTARLSDEQRQLAELEHQNLDVRASLGVSIDQLVTSGDPRDHQAAASAYLLAQAPGPDLSVRSAAAMLELEPAAAEVQLERLVDSGLLDTATPGRYRFHDLIRAYLRQRSMRPSESAAYRESLRRLLLIYVETGWQVAERVSGIDERSIWRDTGLGPLERLGTSAEDTVAWLQGEQRHLLELARLLASLGTEFDDLLVQLSLAMMPINLNQAAYDAQLILTEIAGVAAARLGDVAAQGLVAHDRGAALAEQSLLDEAVGSLETALGLFRKAGDSTGAAMVLRNLCFVYGVLGRLEDGLAAGQEALRISKRRNPPLRLAQCYMLLGSIYGEEGLGDEEQQLQHFERSLEMLAAEYQPNRAAFALKHIGAAHRRAGRLPMSAELLEASILASQQQGQLAHEVVALIELCRTQAAMGDVAASLQTAHEAIELAEGAGIQSLHARALQAVGSTLAGDGKLAAARASWEEALAIYRQLGAVGAITELEDLLADRPAGPSSPTLWHDGRR